MHALLAKGGGATPATAALASAPRVKYPVQYEPADVNEEHLKVFAQSMQLYEQFGKHREPSSSFLLASTTIAATYEAEMKKFTEDTEQRLFADYPSSTFRADWQRIKAIQSSKSAHSAHSITVKELRSLRSFQPFLHSPKVLNGMSELLSEYATSVSMDTSLPAFAKAAWMSAYFFKIIDAGISEAKELANLLLVNWVLLQQDVPFLLDERPDEDSFILESVDLGFSIHFVVQKWLLDRLVEICSEFDERFNNALTPTAPIPPEPQDPEKIVNAHRKKLHESEVCFICFDDSVRCTVSLLCCGQATHSRCLQQWHDTDNGNGGGSCPGCRQRCVEPEVVNDAERVSEREEHNGEYGGFLCANCGERNRAVRCSNNWCGRCCGELDISGYCSRHRRARSRRWAF